jgi:hypothetical protein
VQQVGGLIDLESDLDTTGGRMKLRARGRFGRSEPQGGKTGGGVKLVSSRLERVE